MSQPPSDTDIFNRSSNSVSHHRVSQIQAHLNSPSPQQQYASCSTSSSSSSSTTSNSSSSSSSNFPFPHNGGYNKDGRATATCYCGAVQLEFPTTTPHLIGTFLCHCHDCRKITASMFASNFIVTNKSLRHIRGQELLTEFTQTREIIATGNAMTNHFCSRCGSLMYRRSSGFPGTSILRIGTVDDFALHEAELKPRVEQFGKDRVEWLRGRNGAPAATAAAGVKQVWGNYYDVNADGSGRSKTKTGSETARGKSVKT